MGIQWVTGWTCLHYLCEQIARVFTGLPCSFGRDTWKRKTLKPLEDRVTKDHDGEPERRVSFMEEAAKILHKMPASRVPSYTAKTACHVCVRFKWWRQRNLSMHSPHPRFKGSFANAERASGKIPHAFTIKSPCHRKEFAVSLGWLGTLSKIPTLNAVFLMVKSWTLESRVRQGCYITEMNANYVRRLRDGPCSRARTRNQRYKDWKRMELALFGDDMIVCVKIHYL